ncbi:MAG: DNA-binding transcriptional ArsR family regulator [Natronomonas sp.]|jgi:DNA-binding transcriptional ArsR family regulator
MRSRQGQTFGRSPQQRTERTIENETEITTLMGALEDTDCRAILEATSEEALAASELCEICDLSSSTAYRKLDQLTDAGLLEESIRLSQSGSHTSEYSLAVSDLEIELRGGLELRVTSEQSGLTAAAD